MMVYPEKAQNASKLQARFGSPVTPKKRNFKEVILTTTAGYIASFCVIACFFVIGWLGGWG